MIKNIDHANVIHYGFESLIIKSGANGLSKPSCLKVLKDEFPSKEVLSHLDNEFAICSKAKCSSVRRAFKREKLEEHEVIVLEYIAGNDLNKHLSTEKLPLFQQLHLAADIASALADLHKENIFHQRIQPSNIIIEHSTSKVFFIDFALATKGSSFEAETVPSGDRESEYLKYIAPEQTGRINHAIDNRADLYSLGICLYQIFTGQLPFESEARLELMYANIAKTPPKPVEINPDLPLVVSHLIMKLLSKNAEDRYQSAFGIKYDLEKCLRLLTEDEKADARSISFPIATFDFSGKLHFHDKLFGRVKETSILNNSFDSCANGQKIILFVSGNSGSGKSALVQELKTRVLQNRGVFIEGKFDQIGSDIPFPTIVQAFSELVHFILAGDKAFQEKWKKKIIKAIGSSGRILTQFMPGIDNLIGKQPDEPGLQGIEAKNRLNYEFIRFFESLADKDSPLVIFVDDLQWADASSLNLFKIISESRNIKYAMLIGAYRNNDVVPGHPLLDRINELEQALVPFKQMKLNDLTYQDVYELICDTLFTSQENISTLAEIIYNKTKGNVLYAREFLKSIFEEGLLYFDFDKIKWQFNSDLIMQMNVSGNVVELMTSFISKLPAETLEMLKTASSIGNTFSKRNLSFIKQVSERKVESLLNIPVTEGLIIPSETEYKFAHDRIQQAIYSLISSDEKASIHLLNGQRLAANCNTTELQEKLFDIVNQWNFGSDNIHDDSEKKHLAHLNLMAGRKAIASTAFPQALLYFEKALKVLETHDWASQYDFMLQLTTDAAEAAYLSGHYEKVDELVGIIFQHSKSLTDSAKAYEINIKKLIAQNKPLDAVKVGLDTLRKMGIHLPLNPGKLHVMKDLLQIKILLRSKSMDFYNNLPEMKDADKNAVMRILSDISSASFFAAPDLVPLLAFKMIRLTIKHGLSRKSPFSFAAYGYILSVYLNEIDKGIKFGEIALHLARKIHAEELIGSILVTSNIFLVHRRTPLPEMVQDLENSFTSSLESGDNEYASYAAHNIVYQLFIMGYPLSDLSKRAEMLELKIEKFQQDLTLKRLQLFRQSISNLIEDTANPDILTGKFFDETEMDSIEVTKSNEIYFQNLYLQKLYLALIFNLHAPAEKYVSIAEKYQESVKGTALYPLFYYYRSLLLLDTFSGVTSVKSLLSQVRKDINMLKKYEKYSPKTYSHKILLLEAEMKFIEGSHEDAKILFDKSLKAGTESNMTNNVAYTWERAGRFFINTRQDLLANFYLQNAYRLYKRWGATAKLKQMESQYIQLRGGGDPEWRNPMPGNPNVQATGNVDLETLLKASSTLSGEIILPRLLKKMMQIIMENAGAQNGFLIMEKEGGKFIEAEIKEGDEDIKILQSISLSQSKLLAESVINYVYLTNETVILDDACKSVLFANDDFIKNNECKSILCFPLINMGKIQGVIYLANDLISGAFTAKGVGILKLLAGQMAISIENALFYSELENKVKERTHELQIEKKKSDDLLLNILPEDIANELKQTGRTKPRSYEIATVMFTDFENFTSKSENLLPEELVNLIDTCFTKFDEIISKNQMEKIKTIGDSYLCVSGLPDKNSHNPISVVTAAIEILDTIRNFKNNVDGKTHFDIRIGIHTGPLVAGVVGDKKFAFDIWGDTVNTASRMEQNSEPNKINISQSTYELVKDTYHCTYRGKKTAKNKGMIEMYFVDNPTPVTIENKNQSADKMV